MRFRLDETKNTRFALAIVLKTGETVSAETLYNRAADGMNVEILTDHISDLVFDNFDYDAEGASDVTGTDASNAALHDAVYAWANAVYAQATAKPVKARSAVLRAANPMRGGADFKLGSTVVFWCECPDVYLRRVGFADAIYRGIRHTGWFLDDEGVGGKARGIVFQLPASHGKERFMYGIADPHNNGPAVLAREVVDNSDDAARFADHIAEVYAENECEFNRASDAGFRYGNLGEEIADRRKLILELCAERRELRKTVSANQFPAACSELIAAIKRGYAAIVKAREERAELMAGYGDRPGFES